jgi:hypothetical protein
MFRKRRDSGVKNFVTMMGSPVSLSRATTALANEGPADPKTVRKYLLGDPDKLSVTKREALMRAAKRLGLVVERPQSRQQQHRDEKCGSDALILPIEQVIALPKRVLFAHCRAGKITGAFQIGRRWLIRREDVAKLGLATVDPIDAVIEADVRRRFRCDR